MSIEFKSVAFTATSTSSTPYTVPAGKTAILIGIYFNNPITVQVYDILDFIDSRKLNIGGVSFSLTTASSVTDISTASNVTVISPTSSNINCRRVIASGLSVSVSGVLDTDVSGSTPVAVPTVSGTLSIIEITN